VASAEDRIISSEQRTLIEHLRRERISLRGICRAVGVSLTWLLHFMVERFAACLDHLLAMDAKIRQIIAFHVGDRSPDSAKQLWAKIPLVYREQTTFHTDQYEAYQGVISAAGHKAITKHARRTNYVERFNNTLRQRVSRLVRETLSFSKQLAHHIGAIKYFICHYNLTRAAALPV
jgi:insertion element IS1 protein InsB